MGKAGLHKWSLPNLLLSVECGRPYTMNHNSLRVSNPLTKSEGSQSMTLNTTNAPGCGLHLLWSKRKIPTRGALTQTHTHTVLIVHLNWYQPASYLPDLVETSPLFHFDLHLFIVIQSHFLILCEKSMFHSASTGNLLVMLYTKSTSVMQYI